MAETPAELTAAAKSVLNYRPDIQAPVTPAIPGQEPEASTTGSQQQFHISQTYALGLLAAWGDLQKLQSWMTNSLSLLETDLAGVQVVIGGDVLRPSALQAVRDLLGKSTIGLADIQQAMDNPGALQSSSILKIWDRAMFGYDGSIAGTLYVDLYLLNKYQMSSIQKNLEDLVTLSNFTLAGDSTGSLTVLASIGANGASSITDEEQIAGYMKVGNTIIQQVSDLYNTSTAITNAVNAQSYAGNVAAETVAAITAPIKAQGNSAIASIISILQTLEVLYEIWNNSQYFSMASLMQKIDTIIQDLLLEVLGLAVSELAHVESQLMAPIVHLLRGLDSIAGGAAESGLDRLANQLIVLLNGIVGKFESHLLDMYRNTSLHNNLTQKRTDTASQNNSIRNTVQVVNALIEALQLLENPNDLDIVLGNVVSQFATAAVTSGLPAVEKLGSNVVNQTVHTVLPALPVPAQNPPSPNAPITTVLVSKPGLNVPGNAVDIASSLLSNTQQSSTAGSLG